MVAANDILGYYRLIAKIGAGGMGEVWTAEDTRLARTVAIKILPPDVAADQEAIARMRREARTAAQINSPNIATIYSFEEIGERLFIVMEYVEGEPLSKLIARGPMPEAELCRIGREVAEALAEAHAKGIIHRDIKPDNIIISGRRVKVLDFGIAKHVTPAAGSNDPTAYLTQQGMIIGTVQYMSPEQALGKTLDTRTDIFSLGIVLYQAATGRLPFQGETATETITKIVRDEPVDVGTLNRSLSPGVAKIIGRCLRKPREQRFASAADLASALETQMAKASTAPMTGTPAPAPPAVLTGSKLRTVIERPPKKSSSMALFAGLFALALLIAVGAITLTHRAPAPQKVATPETPPPSATATTTTGAAVAPQETAPQATVTVTPIVPPPAATAADAPAGAAAAPQGPPSAQLFAGGLNDLVAGREGQARREFAAAVAADPQNTKARLGLAITNHNWPFARELARNIHAQNPDDPDLQRLRDFIVEIEQRPRPRRRFH